GIATANMDSSPMVAVTGQVASGAIGKDAFQEAFILGISMPIVKHSLQVRATDDIPRAVHDAFYIASTGRPGPVLIDFPVDVQKASGEYRRPESSGSSYPGYSALLPEDIGLIEEAGHLIRNAERPVIIAGNGVNISRAFDALREFSEMLCIPVTTSLLGKGTIPGNHPNRIGMLGMHGHAAANRAVTNADVIIAVGTRLSDRSTGKVADFWRRACIIHLDVDQAEIRKNVETGVWLLGDASRLLRLLAKEASGHDPVKRAEWMERIREFDELEPVSRKSINGQVHPWQVLDALDEVTRGDVIVTTEVGQHQMWAAQYHRSINPRSFITSGGLGTMGFGIPAAMGAHCARPGVPVVCVAGDGSAMMNIQELDTYARYRMPIKVFVLDNNCLGMVRQWQELFCGGRYSNTLYNLKPDFVKIAQGMGVDAFFVDDSSKVKGTIERVMEIPGPALIHFTISQSDNVFPMVPAGESLESMIV
ncbi:MAG: biosynthetic-type acetolactate synthase large subunit, partial [Synergistaceae bacterium]|nr:biosynthetic-type acetolactate synthase large subunit [Synergistaceae bacterium]